MRQRLEQDLQHSTRVYRDAYNDSVPWEFSTSYIDFFNKWVQEGKKSDELALGSKKHIRNLIHYVSSLYNEMYQAYEHMLFFPEQIPREAFEKKLVIDGMRSQSEQLEILTLADISKVSPRLLSKEEKNAVTDFYMDQIIQTLGRLPPSVRKELNTGFIEDLRELRKYGLAWEATLSQYAELLRMLRTEAVDEKTKAAIGDSIRTIQVNVCNIERLLSS